MKPLHIRWDEATAVPTPAKLQEISGRYEAGHAEVRIHNKRDVMVHFPEAGESNSEQMIMRDVQTAAGNLHADKIRKGLMGGNLVVHMPVAAFQDKFGGQTTSRDLAG